MRNPGRNFGIVVGLVGCANPVHQGAFPDDTGGHQNTTYWDSAADTADGPTAEDDATIIDATFPASMACGESASAVVTVRNVGTATWTHQGGYKLGAVDDNDPFYSADTRIWLPEDGVVEPLASWSFSFNIQAPAAPGTYTTDWRMVHENVAWFGEATSFDIEVECHGPSAPTAPPNFNEVTWLHNDVSGWPETATLASVSVSSTEICLDYDKANSWGVVDMDGTDVVGNPWIFIWHEEQWYAATWEWLRPGQTCKSVDAVAGSHIKQSPFGADSGWVPTSGERYWFMVSGLARTSLRNNEERTGLVEVIWP